MNALKKLVISGFLVAASTLASSAFAGEAMLFERPDMSDSSLALRSDVADLGAYGVPVRIGSIYIPAGNWELCSDREFRGRCQIFGPGEHRNLNNGAGEQFLSAREARYRAPLARPNVQPRIELYPEVDFRGAGLNHFRDTDGLRWGARSLIVHAGTWELCTDTQFRGRCQVYQPGQYALLDGQMMGARSVRVLPDGAPVPVPPPSNLSPGAAIVGAIIAGALGQPNGATAPAIVGQPGAFGNGRAHFFPGPGLTGQPLTLVGDVANFKDVGFNDATVSMRIESGFWEVCTDSDYRGACRTLAPGDYRGLYSSILDRSISSARMVQPPARGVPVGTQDGVYPAGAPETPHLVMLFDQGEFRGETYRANQDMQNLRDTTMNDRAQSVYVRDGRWEFCTDSRYRGTCVTLGPGSYRQFQYPMDRSISSFRRVQ